MSAARRGQHAERRARAASSGGGALGGLIGALYLYPPLRRSWNALRPTWFVMLIVGGVAGLIVAAGQMKDILEYTVDQAADGRPSALAFMYGQTALLAITAWFFARSALRLHYPFTERDMGADDEQAGGDGYYQARKWLPRLLGALVPAAIAIGFGRRALATGRLDLSAHAVGFVALAVLLTAFFIYRHRIPLLGIANYSNRYTIGKSLRGPTVLWIIGLLAVGFVQSAWFILEPVEAPRLVGAAGLVLGSAAAWIATVTALIMWSSFSRGPPVVASLVLVAILFSFWNDNHEVATRPGPPRAPSLSLEAQAWAWFLDRKAAILNAPAEQPYPIVFVAAEGGGIRAAYASAAALALVDDDTGGALGEHLFAASGVSGGSLGISAYLAARAEATGRLADRAPDAEQQRCGAEPPTRPWAGGAELGPRVKAFLRQDHLSPALAGLLFVDLPQRFSPVPDPQSFGLVDRAHFIECSWRLGWAAGGGDAMGRDFLTIAREASPDGLTGPTALLTTVGSKTGRQWVVANARLDPPDADEPRDVLAVAGGGLSAAAAAHLSSRFTYLSPAGTLSWCSVEAEDGVCPPEERRVERFVDGAYYENSGAEALRRALRAALAVVSATCSDGRRPAQGPPAEVKAELARLNKAPGARRDYAREAQATPCLLGKVAPIVLLIDSDTRDAEGALLEPDAYTEAVNWWDAALAETVSPLRAVLATREARGRDAILALGESFCDWVRPEPAAFRADGAAAENVGRAGWAPPCASPERDWLTLAVVVREDKAEGGHVPLGWLLSRSSVEVMDRSIAASPALASLILTLRGER